MRTFLLALFLATARPGVAAPLECTDRPECWPEGSAMRTGLLLGERRKDLEKILARQHNRLIQMVSSGTTANAAVLGGERLLLALRTQQQAWLKYRDAECELVGSLSGAGGAWPSTHASKCAVDRTELRLQRVRSAIRCVESLPRQKRWLDQNHCLQQLATLSNG